MSILVTRAFSPHIRHMCTVHFTAREQDNHPSAHPSPSVETAGSRCTVYTERLPRRPFERVAAAGRAPRLDARLAAARGHRGGHFKYLRAAARGRNVSERNDGPRGGLRPVGRFTEYREAPAAASPGRRPSRALPGPRGTKHSHRVGAASSCPFRYERKGICTGPTSLGMSIEKRPTLRRRLQAA